MFSRLDTLLNSEAEPQAQQSGSESDLKKEIEEFPELAVLLPHMKEAYVGGSDNDEEASEEDDEGAINKKLMYAMAKLQRGMMM